MSERHDDAIWLVKLASAWAAVGITSWADAASAVATCYTAMLAIDFLWKKFGRPAAERHGLVKRRRRRSTDYVDFDEGEHG